MRNEVYNCDCMDFLKKCADKEFDLEGLAALHGCGDWPVKIEIGGVRQGAFEVSRYWSHEKVREKFVLIE